MGVTLAVLAAVVAVEGNPVRGHVGGAAHEARGGAVSVVHLLTKVGEVSKNLVGLGVGAPTEDLATGLERRGVGVLRHLLTGLEPVEVGGLAVLVATHREVSQR
eukprot:162138_1